MTIVNDLSANTIVIGVCIGLGTWILKRIGNLILEAMLAGTKKAIELIAKMTLLESKMDEFLMRTSDHEKLRTDLNENFKQLRAVRADLDSIKHREI